MTTDELLAMEGKRIRYSHSGLGYSRRIVGEQLVEVLYSVVVEGEVIGYSSGPRGDELSIAGYGYVNADECEVLTSPEWATMSRGYRWRILVLGRLLRRSPWRPGIDWPRGIAPYAWFKR